MLVLDLLFGNPLMPDIRGIIAGHLYYFLTVLYPLSGGKYIFKTPLLVYPFFAYFNMTSQENNIAIILSLRLNFFFDPQNICSQFL